MTNDPGHYWAPPSVLRLMIGVATRVIVIVVLPPLLPLLVLAGLFLFNAPMQCGVESNCAPEVTIL